MDLAQVVVAHRDDLEALGPRGARSVTVSPTFAVSSALASGERQDTRASPESSSSTPTMVTSRSSPVS